MSSWVSYGRGGLRVGVTLRASSRRRRSLLPGQVDGQVIVYFGLILLVLWALGAGSFWPLALLIPLAFVPKLVRHMENERHRATWERLKR